MYSYARCEYFFHVVPPAVGLNVEKIKIECLRKYVTKKLLAFP